MFNFVAKELCLIRTVNLELGFGAKNVHKKKKNSKLTAEIDNL